MNNYLTFNARAKIKRLMDNAHLPNNHCVAVELISPSEGGFSIRFLFSRSDASTIIVSNNPPVLTDFRTFQQMERGSIDFDYDSVEFIIKRNKNVVSAYA